MYFLVVPQARNQLLRSLQYYCASVFICPVSVDFHQGLWLGASSLFCYVPPWPSSLYGNIFLAAIQSTAGVSLLKQLPVPLMMLSIMLVYSGMRKCAWILGLKCCTSFLFLLNYAHVICVYACCKHVCVYFKCLAVLPLTISF